MRFVHLKCDKSLENLSNMFNPVLRCWANDYGYVGPNRWLEPGEPLVHAEDMEGF